MLLVIVCGQVQEILKNGGRPETPPSADMMPQYKELMKNCWVQEPGNRPTFKQVITLLSVFSGLNGEANQQSVVDPSSRNGIKNIKKLKQPNMQEFFTQFLILLVQDLHFKINIQWIKIVKYKTGKNRKYK